MNDMRALGLSVENLNGLDEGQAELDAILEGEDEDCPSARKLRHGTLDRARPSKVPQCKRLNFGQTHTLQPRPLNNFQIFATLGSCGQLRHTPRPSPRDRSLDQQISRLSHELSLLSTLARQAPQPAYTLARKQIHKPLKGSNKAVGLTSRSSVCLSTRLKPRITSQKGLNARLQMSVPSSDRKNRPQVKMSPVPYPMLTARMGQSQKRPKERKARLTATRLHATMQNSKRNSVESQHNRTGGIDLLHTLRQADTHKYTEKPRGDRSPRSIEIRTLCELIRKLRTLYFLPCWNL